MAKETGNPWARVSEAEEEIKAMHQAERNPNPSESEAEFRRHFRSFLALARSAVTMPRADFDKIERIIKSWDHPAQALFRWFKDARNEDLKGGVSAVKVRMVELDEMEYATRFPRNPFCHPAFGSAFFGPPGCPPPKHNVPVFELEIDGATRSAIEASTEYLELVRRFLGAPGLQ